MRIVLDAMGSDNFPTPDVAGAVQAARELDVEVILVGDEALIAPALKAQRPGHLPISIVHAPEMIGMEAKGLSVALKAKQKTPTTSLAVGIDLIKSGKGDAFVTAGNTGAAGATAFFRLGLIPGIERPALAPPFPTRKGFCTVLDIGVTPDIQPRNLLEFAVMGSVYAEIARGVQNPRVALLSNGEEAGKGSALVREAFPMLKESGLNFIGNVEPKELYAGECDVAVIDGFAGNIFLKTSEAVSKMITDLLRERVMASSLPVQLGGLLLKPALSGLKKIMDPNQYGAAPLLGVDGLMFIGHGRSDSLAIQNAIRVANEAARAGVLRSIRDEVARRVPPNLPKKD
jgi:phosphate acyltransferase